MHENNCTRFSLLPFVLLFYRTNWAVVIRDYDVDEDAMNLHEDEIGIYLERVVPEEVE